MKKRSQRTILYVVKRSKRPLLEEVALFRLVCSFQKNLNSATKMSLELVFLKNFSTVHSMNVINANCMNYEYLSDSTLHTLLCRIGVGTFEKGTRDEI